VGCEKDRAEQGFLFGYWGGTADAGRQDCSCGFLYRTNIFIIICGVPGISLARCTGGLSEDRHSPAVRGLFFRFIRVEKKCGLFYVDFRDFRPENFRKYYKMRILQK